MKNIEIKANAFFELLRQKDTSMWEIFSQMIDGEEKELIFLDDEGKVLFGYRLPENVDKLEQDRKLFSEEFAGKISKNHPNNKL